MGRDKYEFPPSGKPVVKYTYVQQNMAREQQLALEVCASLPTAPFIAEWAINSVTRPD